MKSILKALCLLSLSFGGLFAEFLEAERAQALKEKKLILLTIESDGCPYCAKMKKEVFDNPKYKKEIDKKFIFVSKNVTDPTLPEIFQVPATPANAVLIPATKEIVDAYTGYIAPDTFMEILNNAYKTHMK